MESRATLEVIAPSIEEAIEKGLSDLGLTEDQVEIEVLDPGSRGLFGLGSRLARVRLTVITAPDDISPTPLGAIESHAPQTPGMPSQPELPPAKPAPRPEPVELSEGELPAVEASAGQDATLRIAEETVRELLSKMKVNANITSYYGEPDDPRSRIPVCVDVSGKDLSILIGRQAETLNALQYITTLIVGKELGQNIPIVLDVEGYRKRRYQQLRQLARRMAEQALKTGRRQALEPMPSNERRIVHIELRNNQDVTTESVGNEPRRKVTIIPN